MPTHAEKVLKSMRRRCAGSIFKKIVELRCLRCILMFRWINKQPDELEELLWLSG